MNEDYIIKLKKNIIAIGRLMWEKNLASGLNGNISARIDEESILLTATGSCLGLLQDKDILRMKIDGELLDEGKVSTEKLLHTEVYRNYPEVKAVVHTHTTYTNAYFIAHEQLHPKIFETKVYLGEVKGIEQNTPAVTDAAPVIEALNHNNIVVLRNHGVVSVGHDHFDCFLLIQALEEAVKIDAISRLYKDDGVPTSRTPKEQGELTKEEKAKKKYKLFSKEQFEDIVKYVNEDQKLGQLGKQTDMTMDLAVKLDETGQIYSFKFEQGRIAHVGHEEDVEFLINASEKVWRQVFNREIDPFVATTQKKMHLRGDFAKISKWYAPCSRVFEIWAMVPVE